MESREGFSWDATWWHLPLRLQWEDALEVRKMGGLRPGQGAAVTVPYWAWHRPGPSGVKEWKDEIGWNRPCRGRINFSETKSQQSSPGAENSVIPCTSSDSAEMTKLMANINLGAHDSNKVSNKTTLRNRAHQTVLPMGHAVSIVTQPFPLFAD